MTDERTIGEDGIDLAGDERLAIVEYNELWQDSTYYELLGVPADADRKTVRDAYFALSKRFHPDVYFKREIGPYRAMVEAIFRAVTRAYDVLGNNKQRAQYDELLKKEGVTPVTRKAPPIPAPSPKVTPPTGLREAAQAACAIAAAKGGATTTTPLTVGGAATNEPHAVPIPSPHVSLSSKPPTRPTFPEGVVVPPSLRGMTEAPRRPTPPKQSSAVSSTPPVVDDAVRQRALEAMARRLGASQRRPATASTSAPPGTNAQQVIDERSARVAACVARAEEAKKNSDFATAAEAYKAALQLAKDDANLKASLDAVLQLARAAQVSEHIERAKAAMQERNLEAAAMHWEKAWEGRREDLTLLLNAAESLSRNNEHKRAAELAQRAIAADPKLVKAHVILATVFTAAGLRASARSAIENLARLDPTHPQLKDLREKLGPMTIAEQFGLRGQR